MGDVASETQLAAFLTGVPQGSVVAGALVGDTYADFVSRSALVPAFAALGVTLPTLRTWGGTAWAFVASKSSTPTVNQQLTRGYSYGGAWVMQARIVVAVAVVVVVVAVVVVVVVLGCGNSRVVVLVAGPRSHLRSRFHFFALAP